MVDYIETLAESNQAQEGDLPTVSGCEDVVSDRHQRGFRRVVLAGAVLVANDFWRDFCAIRDLQANAVFRP